MGCGVYYQQLREVESALGTMRRFGIPEVSDAYQTLFSVRGELLAQVGFKFPRSVTQLVKLTGLSPGSVAVWHDIESGWMAEAREKPGALPVYHRVTDEVAMALLKGELTKELDLQLLTPDEYLGE